MAEQAVHGCNLAGGELAALKRDVNQGFSDVKIELGEIRGHLARVHKWRRLLEGTKRRHLAAVHRMGGLCPCCRETRIVDAGGGKLPNLRWDHWKGPGSNDIKATWPVCVTCDEKLENPLHKNRKHTAFASYQDYLQDQFERFVQHDLFEDSSR